MNCAKCKKEGDHNSLLVPKHSINEWLCSFCYDLYFEELEKFNHNFIQPERSKREDFYLEDLINEYMEEMNNNSVYDFLDWYKKRCGALYTMET